MHNPEQTQRMEPYSQRRTIAQVKAEHNRHGLQICNNDGNVLQVHPHSTQLFQELSNCKNAKPALSKSFVLAVNFSSGLVSGSV
eukprot:4324745-Amphidinium_carterae.1